MQHDQQLDQAPTRRDDCDTSRSAARKLNHGLKGIRAQVYETLLDYPDGLTQTELRLICDKRFWARSESSYRKRLPELEAMNLARRTDKRRMNTFGNQEIVWVAAKLWIEARDD